jgi:hypothetical protein
MDSPIPDLSTIYNVDCVPTEDTPESFCAEPEVEIADTPALVSDVDNDDLIQERLILQLYRHKFKKILDAADPEACVRLENMSLEELVYTRKKWDFLLGAESATDMKVSAFITAIYVLENIAVKTNILQCQGLTESLSNDAGFRDDLTRLSLKLLSAWQTKPEYTVPFRVLQQAMAIDKANKLQKIKQDSLKKSAELNTLTSEYNDLDH